ncbi:MAG: AGE family epimerase/isomerase [Kiritimatiellae bacterium]|jgi:mannose/cellobiose epimerase-like protein (N-acyl-D-glucosamine 2-epimerase family)|nr:AGE family epimerase/isomerase [Kiritimatiellia bacterium]
MYDIFFSNNKEKKENLMKYDYQNFHDHIRYILNYWENAVDYDNGGIHFYIKPLTQEATDVGVKCFLMHVRQMYNFSVGAKYGIEGSKEIAYHLYNTLDTVFEKREGLYPTVKSRYTMRKEPDGEYAKMYDHFYAVIGLSKFATVFADKEAYQKAKTLYLNSMHKANDGEYRENGCYAYYDYEAQTGKKKNGNTFLHHAEATVNLLCCAKNIFEEKKFLVEKAEIGKILLDVQDMFANKFFNYEYMITPDGINDDLTMAKHVMYFGDTLAHPMEWIGFLYEGEKVMEEPLQFLHEHGENLTNICLERSNAKLGGCFRNDFYLREMMSSENSSFWSQSEAILNTFVANKMYDTDYTDVAEKMLDFYFKYFIDDEFNGIFSRVDPKGIATERRKGYMFKCDHHSLRMCEKIIDYKLLD